MYNLTIHFGPSAVAWSFLFKNKERADSIFRNVMDAMDKKINLGGLIADDYGQSAYLATEAISGVLLEDTELGTEARILRGLDQARGQARATKRASTDPELQAAMRGQGPSVITPFTNGGFRPQ
jgi:hypothetical protein